jgi:hypothetical protein
VSLTLEFDLSKNQDLDAFGQIVTLYESVGAIKMAGSPGGALALPTRMAIDRAAAQKALPRREPPSAVRSRRLAAKTVVVCERHDWELKQVCRELHIGRDVLYRRLTLYVSRGWLVQNGGTWKRTVDFPKEEA